MRRRVKLLSTLAVMGAMADLTRLCEADTGIVIEADFAPTMALLTRLRSGEAADIAILTAQAIDDLINETIVRAGSRTDIALSFVGLAVAQGAPTPDIGSVEACTTTLLRARAVAYSRIGASGLYFAELIQRLGIAEAINARAVIVASGFTAERLVSGEADLAVQQISELLVVPGIKVVGPLPADIQTIATFSGGLLRDSEPAAAVLAFLSSEAAAPVLRRAGLEPVPLDPERSG